MPSTMCRIEVIAALVLFVTLCSACSTTPEKQTGIRMPILTRQVSVQDAADSYKKYKEKTPDEELLPVTHKRYPCGDDYAESWNEIMWAPVSSVAGGETDFKAVFENAQSGRLFNCREENCQMIVEAISNQPTEKHFALCDVTHINQQIGAPRGCYTIAIQSQMEQWLRVDTKRGPTVMCRAAGFFLPTGSFGVDYVVNANWSISDLLSIVTNALQTDPLKLQVKTSESRRDDRGEVLGVAAHRVSPLLAPYRELVEMESVVEEDTKPNKKVRLKINLLVSRQNSGNLADYRAPNDAQRKSYADRVMSIIRQAFEKNCKTKPDWKDDFTINCVEH